jgi:hypothetical protein
MSPRSTRREYVYYREVFGELPEPPPARQDKALTWQERWHVRARIWFLATVALNLAIWVIMPVASQRAENWLMGVAFVSWMALVVPATMIAETTRSGLVNFCMLVVMAASILANLMFVFGIIGGFLLSRASVRPEPQPVVHPPVISPETMQFIDGISHAQVVEMPIAPTTPTSNTNTISATKTPSAERTGPKAAEHP